MALFWLDQESKSKQFTVNVSYIEIYMEELRDLLALDAPSRDLHVREDSKGNTGESASLFMERF